MERWNQAGLQAENKNVPSSGCEARPRGGAFGAMNGCRLDQGRSARPASIPHNKFSTARHLSGILANVHPEWTDRVVKVYIERRFIPCVQSELICKHSPRRRF